MYFPGENYVFYLQDAVAKNFHKYASGAGLNRWIFTGEWETTHGRDPISAVRFLHGTGEHYEVVMTQPDSDHAVVFTPQAWTEMPVWNLSSQDTDKLYKMVLEKPETLFIRNDVPKSASALRGEKYSKTMRVIWDLAERFQNTKFILFGQLDFVTAFQYGLAGAAIVVGQKSSPIIPLQRVYSPDGKTIKRDELKKQVDSFEERQFETVIEFALAYAKYTPIAVKRFYEDRIRIVTPREYLTSFILSLQDKNHRDFVLTMQGRAPQSRTMGIHGDKRLCDHCTISYACLLYQKGGVCILPGTEMATLAAHFGSRNPDDIIKGVQAVVVKSAERLERAQEMEDEARKEARTQDKIFRHDPEVSKMMNDLIKNAEKMVKLMAPERFGAKAVKPEEATGVEYVTLAAIEASATPQMKTAAIRQLEAAGTDRKDITSFMVLQSIAKSQNLEIETPIVDGVREL